MASRSFFILILSGLCASGCGYRFGAPDRVLPGGYRQVSIPIFKNLSMEPGIEVGFTNALILEFEKSRSARIAEPALSEVEVTGEILDVKYKGAAENTDDSKDSPLPIGTVFTTNYAITLTVRVTLRRKSDTEILWQREFSGGRSYTPPQITRGGINSVNPLYNLSSRRQNIQVIATELMSEAHDGISENF